MPEKTDDGFKQNGWVTSLATSMEKYAMILAPRPCQYRSLLTNIIAPTCSSPPPAIRA